MPLDVSAVRGKFPALQRDDHVYFDNAGGSQVLASVADRVRDYLLSTSVQLGADYPQSVLAGERVAAARASVARLINARRPEEVIMGPSTTALLRMLAGNLATRFQPGDEIIVSESEHEANVGPWQHLAERGLVIRTWPVSRETLTLEIDALRGLLTERTKLVCVTHASNILGTINPIAEIARIAHGAGAKLCVDAVAYAPHRMVDVSGWDVDYYVFSFYKVYGPHLAVLYGKYDDLLDLPGDNHFFIEADQIPYKFQPGNVNYELSYGCTAIEEYLLDLGRAAGGKGPRERMAAAFESIAAQEQALAERLLAYLATVRDVRVIGAATADRYVRVPTISFVIAERDSAEIVKEVNRHKIGIRYGDFYARRLMDALGLSAQNGVIRVSMVHYNTLEEVDRLTDHLDRVLYRNVA
jgi:cysteine desulfurase family protein (TIGR01976 family)